MSVMELSDYYCQLCGPYAPLHRYHCGNCNGFMDGMYSHMHGLHMDPVTNKFVVVEHHFKCDEGACENAHAARAAGNSKARLTKKGKK
jgi:hypothetical protein